MLKREFNTNMELTDVILKKIGMSVLQNIQKQKLDTQQFTVYMKLFRASINMHVCLR